MQMKQYAKPEMKRVETQISEQIAANCWGANVTATVTGGANATATATNNTGTGCALPQMPGTVRVTLENKLNATIGDNFGAWMDAWNDLLKIAGANSTSSLTLSGYTITLSGDQAS